MSVQEYLDKHMLSRKIETAVNAAVKAKTPDPVLFISNHMRKAVPSVITKLKARQILDSRGIPTVEVDLHTNKGMFRAAAPSGDATGMYEAVELRDGDKGTYLGNSVIKAVKNINEKISEALIGMDPTHQFEIDQAMIDLDKSEKKGELGANAILAVSIAACKAGAAEKEVPLYKYIADLYDKTNSTLPVPAFTVISGGKHAGNSLAIQDIMILPTGAGRFEEALKMGSETYHHLKAVITERYGAIGCNVGEDGGFAPNISSIKEGLDLVKEAISRTGYNDKIKIGIDVAAAEFCTGTKYDLEFKSPNKSGLGQPTYSTQTMQEMKIYLLFGLALPILFSGSRAATLTVKNNCPYTIWPADQTANEAQLPDTGFELATGASTTLQVPAPWTGRVWGRTGCNSTSGRFTCATADCGSGQVACNGAGGATPATLAEFTVAANGGQDFYDVSLVDGFNLPVSITPQGGSGKCSTTSCEANVNSACPSDLAVRGSDGSVISCKSACVAFNQPQYCCTGQYNTANTCKPTNYSMFFKDECPLAYSYAFDDLTGTFTCSGGPNYLITFCP